MCGTLYMEYKYDISVRKNGGHTKNWKNTDSFMC